MCSSTNWKIWTSSIVEPNCTVPSHVPCNRVTTVNGLCKEIYTVVWINTALHNFIIFIILIAWPPKNNKKRNMFIFPGGNFVLNPDFVWQIYFCILSNNWQLKSFNLINIELRIPGIWWFQSELNENMPLKYKQMHLDHDLSASVCHLPSLKIRKWYSEVVNRKEDRQYNGLKNTSTKHYTEN
jgi:hypothetical protein